MITKEGGNPASSERLEERLFAPRVAAEEEGGVFLLGLACPWKTLRRDDSLRHGDGVCAAFWAFGSSFVPLASF